MCLYASTQHAASFCGFGKSHCCHTSCWFAALLLGFTVLLHLCLTQSWLIENAFFFFCQGKLAFEKKPFGQPETFKLNGFNRTFLFPSVMEPSGLDCDVFLAAVFKSFPPQALWNPDPL